MSNTNINFEFINLQNLCDTLHNFTTQQISDYRVKLDSTTGNPEIACFTKELETFLAVSTP